MRSRPCQSKAMPWPGRSGPARAVLDPERLGDVALQAEAVRLQVRAVRQAASRCTVTSWAPWLVTGRLKASASCAIFMKAVTPPQLVTSGSGNLTPPPRCRPELHSERGSRRRDRQPALARDAGVAGGVVRDGRLLEPGQVKGFKARAARMASSTLHFMLASTMSGKPSPRCARMALRGRHLPPGWRGDLHLDRAEPLLEIVIGLPQDHRGPIRDRCRQHKRAPADRSRRGTPEGQSAPAP